MFNKADRIIIKKMPQEVIDHINTYWVLDGRQIQDLRPSECMSATQQCYFRLRDQEPNDKEAIDRVYEYGREFAYLRRARVRPL